MRFELLAGVGGSSPLIVRFGGGSERVGLSGDEVVFSDGSRVTLPSTRNAFGQLPLAQESLLTFGLENAGVTPDSEWFFFREPSTLNGESVPGPAWVRASDRTTVAWPSPRGGRIDGGPDGTYWLAGVAAESAVFAGEPLGPGDALVGYVASFDESGVREGWRVATGALQIEGFRVAPDGSLLLLINGGRGEDGAIAGEPLLAGRSAIVRIDPESRTVVDRWDASLPVYVQEGPRDELRFSFHQLVEGAATATIAGETYARLDGMDTWLSVEWDGLGPLPAPQRSTVPAEMRDDEGFVYDRWALQIARQSAADVRGPRDGLPVWARMDDAAERVALAVTAGGDRFGGEGYVAAGAARVHLWSADPVELGDQWLDPLPTGGTLHLVEMDVDTAAVLRHARYPSPADPESQAKPLSVTSTHALLSRVDPGPVIRSLSLVSWDGDPEVELSTPLISGTGCRSHLRVLDQAGTFDGRPEPNEAVVLAVQCDEPGHSLAFAGETLDYASRDSKTVFRVHLEE